MSKEEGKPDPFKNAIDGGTPEGRLLAMKQTYEIELKWRDELIDGIREEAKKDELLADYYRSRIDDLDKEHRRIESTHTNYILSLKQELSNLESQLSKAKELFNTLIPRLKAREMHGSINEIESFLKS